MPVKLSNVPWDDKDPGLKKLEAVARKNSAIVQLEQMELSDAQYSVYTIWSPMSRKEMDSMQITNERPIRHSRQIDCKASTPMRPVSKDSTLKPRSPSVPKSKSQKNCQVSPRSQSLPPNFTEPPILLPQLLESARKGPHLDSSNNLPNSPLKSKFRGKIRQKEALTTLKKFGSGLERVSKISREIKVVPPSTGKIENNQETLAGKCTKGSSIQLKENSNKKRIPTTRNISGKRKTLLNSPSKLYNKKIKLDNVENFLCPLTTNYNSLSESQLINRNELRTKNTDETSFISTESGNKIPFSSKDNILNSISAEPEYIKKKTNMCKKASKTQKSILQYFKTDDI